MATDALTARDVAIVAAAKACVSAIVLASGFRAISDDDFARVVIAQRFAAEPALDPTGTSWLPAPFWLSGGVMALFGRSLAVARTTSLSLGIGAALAVLIAAHWAGLPRRAALIGAIAAAAIPYAAWLGVATVPDYPAATLIVLGIASLGSGDLRRRYLGALALGTAALCRYEAWPVAAGFAAFSLWDAAKSGRRALALPALLALLGPLGWLVHGALAHGDALFFVARVSAYKRAVGGALPALSALVNQPLAVLRCEPELTAVSALVVGVALALRRTAALRRHVRALVLLSLLLAFLVAGELRASGATHHAERAVLAIWLWLALVCADVAAELWPALAGRARVAAGASLLAVFGIALFVLRPWYARRDSFIDRSAEIAIGRRAGELASAADRLLVDTPDFAFFAVIAGFSAPERAAPFDDRDPRRPKASDPFESAASLRARSAGARFLIVTTPHQRVASSVARLRHDDGRYALFELAP